MPSPIVDEHGVFYRVSRLQVFNERTNQWEVQEHRARIVKRPRPPRPVKPFGSPPKAAAPKE